MTEKTYLTPNAREPEFIVVPQGAVNEQTGLKMKRKVIKFHPNARNVGQYIASDPKEQEWLESHEWFVVGKMIVVADKSHIETPEVDVPAQTVGPVTSEGAVRGGKRRAAKA